MTTMTSGTSCQQLQYLHRLWYWMHLCTHDVPANVYSLQCYIRLEPNINTEVLVFSHTHTHTLMLQCVCVCVCVCEIIAAFYSHSNRLVILGSYVLSIMKATCLNC